MIKVNMMPVYSSEKSEIKYQIETLNNGWVVKAIRPEGMPTDQSTIPHQFLDLNQAITHIYGELEGVEGTKQALDMFANES